MIDLEAIYTAKEVAKLFRVGTTSVYKLASDGDLAFIRIGSGRKSFRFKGSDLSAFLNSRTSGGPALSASSYRHIGKFLSR